MGSGVGRTWKLQGAIEIRTKTVNLVEGMVWFSMWTRCHAEKASGAIDVGDVLDRDRPRAGGTAAIDQNTSETVTDDAKVFSYVRRPVLYLC